MRQLTFRELQTNTEWMYDLPVVVVRRNHVVAIITAPGAPIPPAPTEDDMPTEKKVENIVKGYRREYPGENKPQEIGGLESLSPKKLEKTTEKVVMPSTWLNKYKK
jgi:hypothetical protein